MWSKELPLTASCLSPLSGFESRPGQVRKLPGTWRQVVVFARYSVFLNRSTDLAKIWQEKSDEKRNCNIPKDKYGLDQ